MLGPESYRTYAIVAPLATHFRPATCEEVGCRGWANGWVTRLPVGHELIDLITSGRTGRRYQETTAPGAAEREFAFPAGQSCFRASQHRVPLERDPLFVVKDGDRRGNPRGTRPALLRADQWVDEFATHQDALATARERG